MDKEKLVSEMISYIEEHLGGDITLNTLENEFFYSKFYISRLFKQCMGCTLHKFIQNRRLARAARQLADTDKPIVEIALEACYTTQQAFTSAFLKEYGCTPQVYRRNNERMAA